jgi:steroid delta-isomerase-like uncharacterized protein
MVSRIFGGDMQPTGNPRIDARVVAIDEHVRQENRHDLDALLATFGSHALYEDGPWSERHEGIAAVREYYASLFRAAPDVHIEVKNRHVADDAIVLEVMISGTHLGPWRGLPATGRHLEFPLCAIFTFDENDRMLGERIYYDRATVLRQLGVLSEPTTVGGRLGMLLLHPATVIGAGIRSGLRRLTSRS